jgi:hypothetical protein
MTKSNDCDEASAAAEEHTDALSIVAAEHRDRLDKIDQRLRTIEQRLSLAPWVFSAVSVVFTFFFGVGWFSFKAAINRAAEQIVAEQLPAAVNRVMNENLPKAVGDQVTKALPDAIAALRASPNESVLAAGGEVTRTGDLVTAVSLKDTDVSDGFLTRLGQGGKWANVSAFDLSKTRVTASGLKTLVQYTSLEKLDLYATATTDAGLAQLTHLRKLKSINLQDTQLTDQGAKTLASFPELRELNLRNTRITDEGLVALRTLQHLESLDVRGTRVTRNGIADLRTALPRLAIHSDF